jgi:simple sugar transport system permease protein
MAGLAGAILVFGSESHRMVTDGSSTGFTGSAGFNGIVVALFAGLHPLWSIPSSLLFGGMLVGANYLQRALQVPSALIIALNGLIVVFVVSTENIRQRLNLERASESLEAEQPMAEAEVVDSGDEGSPNVSKVEDAPDPRRPKAKP